MPDEEAGTDAGIFEDELESEVREVAGCRSACANMLKVQMGSRNVPLHKRWYKRWRTPGGQRCRSLHSSFVLLGVWTQSMCVNKQRVQRETFAVKTKESSISFDLFRSVYSPAAALESCTVIYGKNSCLPSAPCGVVYYVGLSACLEGRQAFLIVQSLLMKTHRRIYLLQALSWREGLLLDEVGTPLVHLPSLRSLVCCHTHTHVCADLKVSPWEEPQHFIKSPLPGEKQKLCCAMMCAFLFMLILPISQVCVSTNFSLPCSNFDYHITQT